MNLNEYEEVSRPIDRSKTWVDVKRRRIYSREIRGKWYSVMQKLVNNDICYYLLVTTEPVDNIVMNNCYVDDFGRTTISLNRDMWSKLGYNGIVKDFQLSLKVVDKDDTGTLYLFEN